MLLCRGYNGDLPGLNLLFWIHAFVPEAQRKLAGDEIPGWALVTMGAPAGALDRAKPKDFITF